MGNRGDVLDHEDIKTRGLKGAKCRFAAGARPFDIHLNTFHSMFHGFFGGIFGSQLGGERRALSRSLEPVNTCA